MHTGREHQADRLRPQTASNERENLCRGTIEPLLIIHQADQRPLFRHIGKERQDREADEEQIRRGTGADPERSPQRVALRDRRRSR
jgi:hypothetical protein